MSWKDYFYFTKTERNGITVLIILIIAILFFPMIYERVNPPKAYDFSEFNQQIDDYLAIRAEYEAARLEMESRRRVKRPVIAIQLTPFSFDPNELSTEEFQQLGLPPSIARNIVNYRNAGGTFRFREDLKRIYSIDDELFSQLEQYIQLPARGQPTAERKKTDIDRPHRQTEQSSREVQSWAKVLVDINRADTTEWQQIRGIGPVFSRRITAYRDLLGGFYSIDQLLEVFGMDSTRFSQVSDHLVMENYPLKTININTADFASLIRHPYLDRNQVNSILQMRERHGPYKAIEDVKRSALISEEDFSRLAPYLRVND
jgi:competence protein ComEA